MLNGILMEYEIRSDTPIYKQLYDQINTKIASGEIKPGEKLPTEREMSKNLEIARGTVKKVYEELMKNNIIEKIQGSGCYVRRLPNELTQRPYDLPEENSSIRVAFVDCNLDSLALFKQQLDSIPYKALSIFLLDAVRMDDDPQSLFLDYDLILTTSSHFNELSALLPDFDGKIIKAAVSPCKRTVVEIATIPAMASIGIICRNNLFLNIMKGNLADLLTSNNKVISLFEEDYLTMIESIHSVDVVIAAPDSIIFDSRLFENPVKRIIPFNYQIERGSMIYIEEQIKHVMAEKKRT